MFFIALFPLGKQYCKFARSSFDVIVLRLLPLNDHSVHRDQCKRVLTHSPNGENKGEKNPQPKRRCSRYDDTLINHEPVQFANVLHWIKTSYAVCNQVVAYPYKTAMQAMNFSSHFILQPYGLEAARLGCQRHQHPPPVQQCELTYEC